MKLQIGNHASLDLSVNSIVVMVIAFVVLGLILAFSRKVFDKGTGQVDEIFGQLDLNTPPTRDAPIVMPDTVTVKQGTQIPMKIGVYNKGANDVSDVAVTVSSCKGKSATITDQETPSIVTTAKTIKSSSAETFNVYFSLDTKTKFTATDPDFVCTLSVKGTIGQTPNLEVASRQFFLKVTG